MKTATIKRNLQTTTPFLPYPNAATRQELLNKYIDKMLIAASCLGVTAMITFFISLA